jgi:hypothetical protein
MPFDRARASIPYFLHLADGASSGYGTVRTHNAEFELLHGAVIVGNEYLNLLVILHESKSTAAIDRILHQHIETAALPGFAYLEPPGWRYLRLMAPAWGRLCAHAREPPFLERAAFRHRRCGLFGCHQPRSFASDYRTGSHQTMISTGRNRGCRASLSAPE